MRRYSCAVQRAGAFLAFALACFFDAEGILLGAIPAIAVHELGHYAALSSVGALQISLHLGLGGLEMTYRGDLQRRQQLWALGSGPVCGLIYTLFFWWSPAPFWSQSARVSAALTAFNLLPIIPLDGGRILSLMAGEAVAGRCSFVLSLVLMLGGILFLWRFSSPVLLFMSLWLLLRNRILW